MLISLSSVHNIFILAIHFDILILNYLHPEFCFVSLVTEMECEEEDARKLLDDMRS